jgi:DNA-binding LacI/PurR family transcriptional regulator
VHLNNSPNIIVCCNNELALHAISELAQSALLKAVVVPEKK